MLSSTLFDKFGREFKAGHIIFCEFEPGNDFYLIQSGRVKIIKVVKDKVKIMDVLHAGDIFGEMAILEESPRSASALALDDVSVLHFNRDNFVALMTSQPQLAYKMLVLFSKRIYDAKRRLNILLLDELQVKVADVFIMLTEKEPNFEHLKHVVIPTSVDSIAHWAGEPVEEVIGVINHWSKVGKLDLYADKIVLNNLNDFKRLVNAKKQSARN